MARQGWRCGALFGRDRQCVAGYARQGMDGYGMARLAGSDAERQGAARSCWAGTDGRGKVGSDLAWLVRRGQDLFCAAECGMARLVHQGLALLGWRSGDWYGVDRHGWAGLARHGGMCNEWYGSDRHG